MFTVVSVIFLEGAVTISDGGCESIQWRHVKSTFTFVWGHSRSVHVAALGIRYIWLQILLPPSTKSMYHELRSYLCSTTVTMPSTMTIISENIEGLSSPKRDLIAKLCSEHNCQVLCLQETHRGPNNNRPNITGMKMAIERPHEKYGSAIYVKPDLVITSTSMTENNDIEILTVNIGSITITSVYKPPTRQFQFDNPDSLDYNNTNVVIGDFNSHSTSWGYNNTDENGDLVEEWSDAHHLSLIHDPKLPCSFNSSRWKRGYNPDLSFVSNNIASLSSKAVLEPIPHTQHRPIAILINAAVTPTPTPFRRRFNFKKANWKAFSTDLDTRICDIDPSPENYDRFVKVVHATARKHIPRGCRKNYVPGLTTDLAEQYNEYIQLYEQDPFSADTITAGDELAQALTVEQRKMWQTLIENTDMTHNSKKAWSLIKKLSNDPRKADQHVNVTPNQVAHQLIVNGKVPNRQRQSKIKRCGQENHDFDDDFIIIELQNSLKHLKNGKAAGLDEILTEEIKNFGPVTIQWVLNLLNACARTHRLPRLWRQARVVALLKPGKDPSSPKSFRPISLLCHLYKLYERVILNRLSPIIEHILIPEQAGFRPGKSCTAQVLNLTQHIEDGFETGKITGIVLVDLSAAYDTVNHRRLLEKVYNMTRDYRLMCMIRTLLENRRFFVELGGKEVDGDHREMAYRRGVSLHHFYSTSTQTTSLFTRARAALCMQTTLLSLHRARTLHRSRKHWSQL